MTTTDTDVRRFGPATHRRVNGLHVLRLRGSHYEMGRQHGALLADQVRRGPIPYFRDYIRKTLEHNGLGPLAPAAALGIRYGVGRRVARGLPPFVLDAVRGLADGAALPYRGLLDGCVMPDSMLWTAARMMQARQIDPAVQHRLALGLGCTSAIAWGDATVDGKLLHARNFDYYAVGTWPRTQAVVFHEPDDGHRYVSVAAAGVLLGGVTAMNEAGLTLTVHQHMFTDATALGGTPIGILGDEIMRRASSLDDAQRILEQHRSIGCWTYLIADGKRREVLCFEENPRRQAARRIASPETTFGYANIYLDPELGATERALYGSYWRANEGRHRRVRELLAQRSAPLAPDDMAGILADTGTTSCRIHDAMAMLMTVASVVFSPEDGTVWVATGEAPVCHNAFEPFSLRDMDHAPDAGQLTGGQQRDADAVAAFDAYRRAYMAYFDRGDTGASRRLIDQARALQPAQPLYHKLGGLLAMAERDHAAATAAFDRALELGHPARERVAALHMWRARAADLRGDRAAARAGYTTALELTGDAPVDRAARRGLRAPYRPRNVDVDFSYADVINP